MDAASAVVETTNSLLASTAATTLQQLDSALTSAATAAVAAATTANSFDFRTIAYEVCIPVILLLCLFAALFNLLMLASRFSIRSRSSSLELTYSLAMSDTWTSLVVGFSLFWNSYKPVVWNQRPSSYCFSLALEAFRTGGLLTGVLHLALLAVAHLLQCSRPFDHGRVLSRGRVLVLIAVVWVLPPALLFVYFSLWPEEGFREPICGGASFYESLAFRAVVSLLILLMIVLTAAAYASMLRKINEVRLKTAEKTNGGTGGGGTTSRRTVVTAVLILGTFIVGWLPASLLFVLSAKGMPLYRRASPLITVLFVLVQVAIMVKSLTNPVIYAIRIPEIRQFMSRLGQRISAKRRTGRNTGSSSSSSKRRREHPNGTTTTARTAIDDTLRAETEALKGSRRNTNNTTVAL